GRRVTRFPCSGYARVTTYQILALVQARCLSPSSGRHLGFHASQTVRGHRTATVAWSGVLPRYATPSALSCMIDGPLAPLFRPIATSLFVSHELAVRSVLFQKNPHGSLPPGSA